MRYERSEALKRFALFLVATQLAGAFGNLLATAVSPLIRPITPLFLTSWEIGPFLLHETQFMASESS